MRINGCIVQYYTDSIHVGILQGTRKNDQQPLNDEP